MASEERILDLPEDIDDQIEAFLKVNPGLTVEWVIRDICRIACLLRLVDRGILNETTVLTGGIAMRCLKSRRFTVYDSDTSSKVTISDPALAAAIDYSDEDLRIEVASAERWKRSKRLKSAQPISYTPLFTALDAGDTTFSLTVSERGLERDAVWAELHTGYPFRLWNPVRNALVPIMTRNEILAEKLAAWWLFRPAKHYADIAYLGGLLVKEGLVSDPECRSDLIELVETKLDRNRSVSRKHDQLIEALTRSRRKEMLLYPTRFVDPDRGFDKIAYVGRAQPRVTALTAVVRRSIVPLLFDNGPTS